MEIDKSFCRLCGILKPASTQLDLSIDSERIVISAKLCRVNAATDFNIKNLPLTVCRDCLDALNQAVDFVVNVENAQTTLQKLYTIKTENEDVMDDDQQTVSDALCSDFLDSDTAEPMVEIKMAPNEISNHNTSLCETGKSVAPLSKGTGSWANVEWLCGFCEIKFPSIEELQTHSMDVHNSCNPYSCQDCKYKRRVLNRFLIHLQSHKSELGSACYKCHKEFPTVTDMVTHRRGHRTSKFVCKGCNTPFPDQESLEKHTKVYYTNVGKKFEVDHRYIDGLSCSKCKIQFKSQECLLAHVKTHVEKNLQYICEVCGKSFMNKTFLNNHCAMHNNERPYKCHICDASYKHKNNLTQHIGTHTGIKPFLCKVCGMSFRKNYILQSHVMKHTNALPFSCSFCQKNFKTKIYLERHINRAHTTEHVYTCDSCNKKYPDWSNYNTHMKAKHNMDVSKRKRTVNCSFVPSDEIDPNPDSIMMFDDSLVSSEKTDS